MRLFTLFVIGCFLLGAGCPEAPSPETGVFQVPNHSAETATDEVTPIQIGALPSSALFPVTRVVDGDTFDIRIDGDVERVRIIGINTPETVDPRRSVECFGKEASARATALLSGASVRLEADPTQDDRDRYGRMLRHVFLADDTNVGLTLVAEGYAHEYTYEKAYAYQRQYRDAQDAAKTAGRGLWADDACTDTEAAAPPAAPVATIPAAAHAAAPAPACLIKGNISSEKIYHLPGCGSYNQTVIDESKGERWFCTESEAVQAGWRKAKNC